MIRIRREQSSEPSLDLTYSSFLRTMEFTPHTHIEEEEVFYDASDVIRVESPEYITPNVLCSSGLVSDRARWQYVLTMFSGYQYYVLDNIVYVDVTPEDTDFAAEFDRIGVWNEDVIEYDDEYANVLTLCMNS